MHRVLSEAITKLGLKGRLQALTKNVILSERMVRESRSYLRSQVPPKTVPIDVVAVGSFGRQEASAESDFDYLIVVHDLPPRVTQSRQLIVAVEGLKKKLGLKAPGRTGMFGRVVSASDLTEFIGLEDDTNRSLTHRILILGESVSLYQPARHRLLVRRILERYLVDYNSPKQGVPRFLLNDALRYWRTLTVDYQAKRWEQVEPDWGLRYLKLLLSRKLAFAGFLLPLLLCKKATVPYFVKQFSMPPLARIAQLHELSRRFRTPLRSILEIADEAALAFADGTFRDKAKKVIAPGDKNNWPPAFKHMRKRAYDLQDSLEEVFFNSRLLEAKSIRYLSF